LEQDVRIFRRRTTSTTTYIAKTKNNNNDKVAGLESIRRALLEVFIFFFEDEGFLYSQAGEEAQPSSRNETTRTTRRDSL